MDNRETTSTQRGVYGVYLFREDMKGVYLALIQGVTDPLAQFPGREGRKILRNRAESIRGQVRGILGTRFALDNDIDLSTTGDLGRNYELGTVAYKYYAAEAVPDDEDLLADLDMLLMAYDAYLEDRNRLGPPQALGERPMVDREVETWDLIRDIETRGYVYQPWQIAAFITAVRTKPFVILAGITGTGKSKLPALVAEATGAECRVVPVRPDWTDSSDVLGYVDLQGRFRPGSVLEVAMAAGEDFGSRVVLHCG